MAVPVLSAFDFSNTELLNARLQNLGVDPSGLGVGNRGLLWIDGAGSIKYWDGTQVKTLGLATGGDAETLDGQDGTYYLARANHTGTQTASTISDLTEAVQDAVGGALGDTATLDLTYNDGTNTISGAVLDSPTVAGATPAQLRDRATHTGTQAASTISDFAEAISDQLGTMVTGNTETGITVTYDDADNTLDFVVTDSPTVAGQTPAQLRDRSTHTGTQASTTISDFTEAVQDVIGALLGDSATIDVTYNDAANTFTIAVLDSPLLQGQNSAYHRNRTNHTGTQTASTISDFDTQVRTNRLDQMAAPTGAVAMNNQKITGLADGSGTNDAATYGQLLAIIEGKAWKDPVRAATTANITLSGTQTIDGVTLAVGDRVLVKNQSTAAANGIYVVATGAWTRATDANTEAEHTRATVIVQEGTTNAGDVYTQTAAVVTLGTTAQTWTKTGEGNQTYAADGTTLTLTGSTFSITTGGVGATQLANNAVDLSTVKVTGVAPVARGGTGHATYAVGDILFANTTTTLSRLAGVATGNALLSGGVGVAPAWGKIGLTTHVTGTLPVANGGTGGTSVATAKTALGFVTKYATDIGNGALTDIIVTHNLNTRDVNVDVYRATTPWDKVIVDVELTSVNTITLRFATAPTTNAFRVVVQG